MDAFVEDCRRSYGAWCAERSIKPIDWVATPPWERVPGDDLSRLLRRDVPPDGVVTLEDQLGIEIAAVASTLGIRIPDDLKVVAFSDRESFPGVALTSVQLDPATTAQAAVDMVIDLIEEGRLDERVLDIPVRLVRRAST
jgi:DNA-binding LacI/PurR family transcriptional regulator